MHPLLFELELEHGNVRKVLSHLAELTSQLSRNREAVLDDINLCPEYLHVYAEATHHANEDMILSKLEHRSPAEAEELKKITQDHKSFDEIVQRLIETSRNHPRSAKLKKDLVDYVERQRRHLMLEEKYLMPVAEELLTNNDWSEVEDKWLQQPDPVFGPKRRKRFLPLALAIHSE